MTRVRERTTDVNVLGLDWTAVDSVGAFVSNYHSDFTSYNHKRIADVVTPHYGDLVKSGAFLPINPVDIRTDEVTLQQSQSGTMTRKDGGGPGVPTVYSGGFNYLVGSSGFSDPAIDSDFVDNVVIKALASAKTADFDVTTFIGEFGDTIHLFRSVLHRFFGIGRRVARLSRRRVLKRVGKGRRATRAQLVTEFNKLWLEGRYGWRPLVYDAQSLLSLLTEKTANPLARKTGRLVKDINDDSSTTSIGGTTGYTVSFHREGTQTYYATVFYRDAMSHIGSNPVVTAYELTKFSFVCDWFIDVGSWLRAISPREGYHEIGISVSVVDEFNDIATQVAYEGSSHTFSVAMTDHVAVTHCRRLRRFPYDGLIPLPHIHVNLNPLKVMDLIALVVTNRRRVLSVLFGK